jgi:hypothetical protein
VILDDRNELADNLSANTALGVAQLGDTLDLGAGTRGLPELALLIRVSAAFTSGGAATVQFHLVSDAQGALATNGSATHHFSTSALPVAALTIGKVIACVRLPRGLCEQYLGLLQTVAGATLTGGGIDAVLTDDPSLWSAYGDNVA